MRLLAHLNHIARLQTKVILAVTGNMRMNHILFTDMDAQIIQRGMSAGSLDLDLRPTTNGMVDVLTDTVYTNQGSGELVTNKEFSRLSYADYKAHTSGTGNLWLKWSEAGASSACHVEEAAQYELDKEMTGAENDQNESYFTQGTCGAGFAALRDVNGDLILDAGGNVIYTSGE